MGPLCELEVQHGVQLGTGYKNNQEFVKYIAQEQRDLLISMLSKMRFFGIQFDGSTDSANIEELFLVLFFDPYSEMERCMFEANLFTVRQPKSCNAEGLYECFMRAFSYMHVTDWQNKLVGIGCDGANVNMGVNGLRGLVEASVSWVVIFWCLVHSS